MSSLTICPGDNLATLHTLADQGARFDLVELDGPYGAGLEAWDCLTPDEYLAHYTERLTLVRRVLQPWGVVFVFGYPERVAELATWARQSGTLHLRRWLTWYVNSTRHAGRRVQTIAVFSQPGRTRVEGLGAELRTARAAKGWTLQQLSDAAGYPWWRRGGTFYYETGDGDIPSPTELATLARVLDFDPAPWWHLTVNAYKGLTNLDFITVPVEYATQLNDDGLRSKPLGLYHLLFRPVLPPRPDPAALILYGGSGNAAIAAGQLGYTVTVCEADAARCEHIRRAWAAKVERRDLTPHHEYGPLFAGLEVA